MGGCAPGCVRGWAVRVVPRAQSMRPVRHGAAWGTCVATFGVLVFMVSAQRAAAVAALTEIGVGA